MTTAIKPKNVLHITRERLFSDIFERLEGVLHPGSEQRIRDFFAPHGAALPVEGELVQRIFDHLETEAGSRNVRPDAGRRTGSGKDFEFKWLDKLTPLQRALNALPIQAEKREALNQELGYELGRFTTGEVAREIVGKMTTRAFKTNFEFAYWDRATPNELRVAALLDSRFSDALPEKADRDAFAYKWSQNEQLPANDGHLVNSIASALALQGKIPGDDARKTESAPVAPQERQPLPDRLLV